MNSDDIADPAFESCRGQNHDSVLLMDVAMLGRVSDTLVGAAVELTNSCIFVFERDGVPKLAYENFGSLANPTALAHFLAGTYVLSPYYQAFKSAALPLVCKVGDLPKDPTWVEKDPNQNFFPHVSLEMGALADEICIAASGLERSAVYLAMRRKGLHPYTDAEFDRVSKLATRVSEILAHLVMPGASAASGAKSSRGPAVTRSDTRHIPSEGSVDEFIDDLFPETLSPREQRTVQLTLQGNSVENIGAALAISPHTVRVHLRNAYAKLRVRNRLELIGLFVKRAGQRNSQHSGLPDHERQLNAMLSINGRV